MIVYIIVAAACLVAGCAAGFVLFRYVVTGKYKQIIEEADKEAQVIKEKKLLERILQGIARCRPERRCDC